MNFLANPTDIHLLKNYSFDSFLLEAQQLKTNIRAYFLDSELHFFDLYIYAMPIPHCFN